LVIFHLHILIVLLLLVLYHLAAWLEEKELLGLIIELDFIINTQILEAALLCDQGHDLRVILNEVINKEPVELLLNTTHNSVALICPISLGAHQNKSSCFIVKLLKNLSQNIPVL